MIKLLKPQGAQRITSWAVAFGAFVVGFGGAEKEAAAVEHEVCLYFDIGDEYWDASPRPDGDEYREEYGRNLGSTSYPAQRYLARVTHNKTGTVVFGWAPLDGDGCATVDVPHLESSLTIQWLRWGHWESTGNQLVGYNCDATMRSCDLLPGDTSFFPTRSRSDIVVTPGEEEIPHDTVMWATTFAENRFASLGQNPNTDTRMYATYDEANVLPGATQADLAFGNQPSLAINDDKYHAKFTIAHEFGHVQTVVAPIGPAFGPSNINYCYNSNTYPTVDPGPCAQHDLKSPEWQSAALIEGMAHWYSMATWNDPDLGYPPPGPPLSAQHPSMYVIVSSSTNGVGYALPRPNDQPLCFNSAEVPVVTCPAGVANEWDWASVIQRIYLDSSVSIKDLLQIIPTHFSAGWPTDDDNDSFFVALDLAMQSHFSPTVYQEWTAETQYWGVAR